MTELVDLMSNLNLSSTEEKTVEDKKEAVEAVEAVEKKEDVKLPRIVKISKPKDEAKEIPETKVEIEEETDVIDILLAAIEENADESIVLLKEKEVLQWLFGDLSFLPPIEKKNKTQDTKKYKDLEDIWGREILKKKRPDLELKKQWTNKFGEHIIQELYTLLGKKITKPVNKNGHEPDWEIDDHIIEVKTETYYTDGTAGEKILGCPFKYASVPRLYGKPLKIICLGGAEKACMDEYGVFDGSAKQTPEKKKFLEFYKENQIEFISATSVLTALL